MASDGEAAAVPEGVPADEEMVRTAILHGKRDIRIEDRPPPPAVQTRTLALTRAVVFLALSVSCLRPAAAC